MYPSRGICIRYGRDIFLKEGFSEWCRQAYIVLWVGKDTVGLEHGGIGWIEESLDRWRWVWGDFISIWCDWCKDGTLCHFCKTILALCLSLYLTLCCDYWTYGVLILKVCRSVTQDLCEYWENLFSVGVGWGRGGIDYRMANSETILLHIHWRSAKGDSILP